MGGHFQKDSSRKTFVNALNPYGDGNKPNSQDDMGTTLRKILSVELGGGSSFTGNLAGDVTGPQASTVVGKINGVPLSGLASGLLFNTTSTGHPSIATANQIAAGLTGTTGTLNLAGATVFLPPGIAAPANSIQRVVYTGGVTATATIGSSATSNILAFLNGSTSSTTLTVVLPVGGFDGQTLDMSFNQSATTVAYSGATSIGGLTVSAIGSRQRLIWDSTLTEWR